MNATLAAKKKHPNGHVGGHRGAKTKEKPAKLPHARAREADAKPPPARGLRATVRGRLLQRVPPHAGGTDHSHLQEIASRARVGLANHL